MTFQETQQADQPEPSPMILQPTQSDDDESTGDLSAQFQKLLDDSLNGDYMELATPAIANVNDKGLIVDFQDHVILSLYMQSMMTLCFLKIMMPMVEEL